MALSTALAVSPTPDWMGRKPAGMSPRLQFGGEKIGHVFADARGGFGNGAEGTDFVRQVGFNNAGDFLRVDFNGGRADAVVGTKDGKRFAMGRVFRLVDVVKAAQRLADGTGSAR